MTPRMAVLLLLLAAACGTSDRPPHLDDAGFDGGIPDSGVPDAGRADGGTCGTPNAFLGRVEYDAGSGPAAVITGDFNEDGNLDLVSVNTYGESISVFLGRGDGSLQPRTDFATGLQPSGLATGDFNGDGLVDIAVANFGSISGSFSILLSNGDGTFQPRSDFPTGGNAEGIAVADFDQDGNLDLAIACGPLGVCVHLGNGDGTFRTETVYPLTAGQDARALVIGDFDGDGILDLAVANAGGTSTLSLLLGNGDGTFRANTDFPTGALPVAVAMADLTGHGSLDAVTANITDSTISVLLATGGGNFQPRHDYATGHYPAAVAIGDLNGDGFLDLAVANLEGTISVLLGVGDGTFLPRVDYPVVGSYESAKGVTIGDFDGDGTLDLASANNPQTVSVLLNSCPAVPAVETCEFVVSGVRTGTYPCDGNGVAIYDTSRKLGSVVIGDAPSDPRIGVFVSFAGRPTIGTVYSAANSQPGTLVDYIEGADAEWDARLGAAGNQGTFTLRFSSVKLSSPGSTQTYDVHGTLDAALPPLAGTTATGTVDVHVNF